MIKKTVLITGAAGGIGQATAKLFGHAKWATEILCVDHKSKSDALKNLSNEIESYCTLHAVRGVERHCFWLPCDITNEAEMKYLISNMFPPRKIDVLINIAGIAPTIMTPLVKTELENVKKIMDVNFWGTLNLCKTVLPFMQANGFGRIINIASISAFMTDPGNLVYSASKAAVVQLTRALAKEAPYNKNGPPHDITVNAVAPGIIDTDMAKQLTGPMVEGFKKSTPFGRLGTPEEIAKVIFWLASEAPQFLTGEVIRVDGGFL